jgi:hypothetical protein
MGCEGSISVCPVFFWKQVQFHEMAGFFARMAIGGSAGWMIKLGSKNNGEHHAPGVDTRFENETPIGRPIKIVDGGSPVMELLG